MKASATAYKPISIDLNFCGVESKPDSHRLARDLPSVHDTLTLVVVRRDRMNVRHACQISLYTQNDTLFTRLDGRPWTMEDQ